jgi:hypothetical protein
MKMDLSASKLDPNKGVDGATTHGGNPSNRVSGSALKKSQRLGSLMIGAMYSPFSAPWISGVGGKAVPNAYEKYGSV